MWYGCLGELRSLAPSTSRLLILTATATKATKGEILSTLQLGEDDIKFIEQSPNRPNLKYSVQYLDKNEALQTAFSALIGDLKNQGAKTPRTLLYCQTRKQCQILFRVFEVFLGKNIYHGESKPQNRIVEMYHAGTPSRVKGHIVGNMADEDGHLRVLVSTIAFGMGVNCKKVRRIIHFGPSKSVEMYVQECGRAGRDGLPSTCVLLYNGLLSTHCEKAMKEYLSSSECRRKWLMSHFGFSNELQSGGYAHSCCDVCAAACVCGSEVCPDLWNPCRDSDMPQEMSIGQSDREGGNTATQTRTVSSKDKSLLQSKLLELHTNLSKQVEVQTMVSCPNVLLEFNSFHVKQIVRNCHVLFSLRDVMDVVEIWRKQYAIAVMHVIAEVFGDIDTSELPAVDISGAEQCRDESVRPDWAQVRDDSSLLFMLDTRDLEGVSFLSLSQNLA